MKPDEPDLKPFCVTMTRSVTVSVQALSAAHARELAIQYERESNVIMRGDLSVGDPVEVRS